MCLFGGGCGLGVWALACDGDEAWFLSPFFSVLSSGGFFSPPPTSSFNRLSVSPSFSSCTSFELFLSTFSPFSVEASSMAYRVRESW